MQGSTTEVLHNWQNFYVLTGGSAATLMGLVFVPASLGANLKNSDAITRGMRSFVAPIIINFTTVLLVAAFLTIPTHTYASLSFLLACGGVAGLGYQGSTGVQLWRHHRQTSPVKPEDWFWRVIFPALGYFLVLIVAFGLPKPRVPVLNTLPIAVISFLLIGIRNTWDLVLWIARQQLQAQRTE